MQDSQLSQLLVVLQSKMSKIPKDKQNLERDQKLRYCVQSGQSSIHGDTLYEVQTQEAQSFAFHSGTGQGGSGKGPGTG